MRRRARLTRKFTQLREGIAEGVPPETERTTAYVPSRAAVAAERKAEELARRVSAPSGLEEGVPPE